MQTIFDTTETRIGNTMYIVKTMPSERATETVAQKFVRLVKDRISEEIKIPETPANTGISACN
jgi:hypothetical protein